MTPVETKGGLVDLRTTWLRCSAVSGHIWDQSSIGSCWTFRSTEAFNDRRCITPGDTTMMSVEETTTTCGFFSCFSMACRILASSLEATAVSFGTRRVGWHQLHIAVGTSIEVEAKGNVGCAPLSRVHFLCLSHPSALDMDSRTCSRWPKTL